jgi:hypothetical protein
LFSSDKLRAITDEKMKGRSVKEEDALEDMKRTKKYRILTAQAFIGLLKFI